MDKKKLKTLLNSNAGSQRLQSLKLPRDFNLTASKPKKVYTPNLNVVRNKDKSKQFFKETDKKRKENVSHKNAQVKSDNKSRFLQSTGIFSQGTAEIQRPNTRVEKRYNVKESNDSISELTVPTISRNTWTINKKAENVVLDELLNCDNDSDGDDLAYKPLTLHENNDSEESVQIKEDFFMPGSSKAKQRTYEPFNQENIFSDANPSTCIVKLPYSFAGKGLSDNPNITTLFDYKLSHMLEGQIGTLRIRKSGKMEVQIGQVTYELLSKAPTDFREELSLLTNEKDKGSSLSELNLVNYKFDLVPDFSQD